MAQTKRITVYGTRPPCAHKDRFSGHGPTAEATPRRASKSLDDFIRYADSDDEPKDANAPPLPQPPNPDAMNTSHNFVDYVRSREYGMREYRMLKRHYATRHIITHDLFKEHIIPLGSISKVFCSQWIGANRIAFGTKCNKIMVYNVNSHKMDEIPQVIRRVDYDEIQHNGIYALKQNPSHTLLATGAYNSNEIALYRLPSLDSIVLTTGSHKEQIYDIDWLDDEFFVSVSKDNMVAMWQIQDHNETDSDFGRPIVKDVNSTVAKKCKAAKKLRSVTFNKSLKEIITLSLNGYVHTWDVESFKQTLSRKLTSCQENVCMAMKENGDIYAIGSRSYLLLLDARTLNSINKIPLKYNRSGIRSLSFQDNLITIGTGIGNILFYDIKAGKYLESSMKSKKTAILKTSRGYVFPGEDLLPHQIADRLIYMPAIYTHCYDFSSTRLFCAGGPLMCDISGNYAGLWI